MGNVWIYIYMDSVGYNELAESANARLQASFWLQGQSLPSSSLFISSVDCNLKTLKGCQ